MMNKILRSFLCAGLCFAFSQAMAQDLPTVKFVSYSGVVSSEFTAATGVFNEGAGRPTIFIELEHDGDTAAALSVPFTLSGTATAGDDYTADATAAIFAAGETRVMISFPVIDDEVYDPDETVIVTLTANPAVYMLGDPAVHTITINDNDPLALGLPVNPRWARMAEDAGKFSAKLTWLAPSVPEGLRLLGYHVQIRVKPADPTLTWSGGEDVNILPAGVTVSSSDAGFNNFSIPDPAFSRFEPGTMTDLTFADLTAGTDYQLRFRSASNVTGADSPWTANLESDTAQSTDAALRDLTLNGAGMEAVLTPPFSAEVFAYTAQVPFAATMVTVTPTVNDTGRAGVTVENISVNDGEISGEIDLSVGVAKTISITVTAENGGTQTTTIAVTRAEKSADATLSALVVADVNLNEIMLTPAFTAGGGGGVFTATVADEIENISVTPTSTNNFARITVNDTPVTSGLASGAIMLGAGENEIDVIVTAESGATLTYTLRITRAAPVTVVTLNKLEIPGVGIKPIFRADQLNYRAKVLFATNEITIITVVTDTKATAHVNNSAATDDIASAPIMLVVGDNTVAIVVTANDNSASNTYTIKLTRAAASADNMLTALKISAGTLMPDFSADNLTYSTRIGFSTGMITVTPQANKVASVSVNGNDPATAVTVTAGVVAAIAIVVTAENGDAQTYTLNVSRGIDPAARKVLDVSADGMIDETDGAFIANYLSGLRDADLAEEVAGVTGVKFNGVEINAIEKRIDAEVNAATINVDGVDNEVNETDGILISRYLSGTTSGADLTDGLTADLPAEVAGTIMDLLDDDATAVTIDARKALDVNADALINSADGIEVARYLLGVPGRDEIDRRIKAEVDAGNFNADNAADDAANLTTAADGVLIARYLLGVIEGGALTAGWSATAAADVADEIKSLETNDAVEQ